ncbi:Putative Holliday junction resolvase [Acholeplasma oculi]|uniref:Putative pre-16S rRNA nuclease n=1 Tax=Acholeplasma oculi TaxID=35623 RepID=A0A061ACG2_9MOLU|nr:Holliday junction resolvase RuvX [Acholeplasma oculi]CDR31104.1 Putative Holliday junction resolvase YggF [Acholeplasma oculi]SKC37066.1 putative holliday junction resolvase [Acholeplasma oculi]SUT90799.1 Putative Holliday junction resolvase [Acholeplasma oculi]
MTYLGLDLGDKSLGVAISLSGVIANNHTTIRFGYQDFSYAIKELKKIADQNQIQVIVLGFPKHMNNDVGEKGALTIKFKELMEKELTQEIVLWDERLSTKTALRMLSDSNKKYDKQRQLKDEVAAQVILQNYLDSRRN